MDCGLKLHTCYHVGVDEDYDAAMQDIQSTKARLNDYLEQQKKRLGCKVRTSSVSSKLFSLENHLLLIQCYNRRKPKLKLNELYSYWIALSVLNG